MLSSKTFKKDKKRFPKDIKHGKIISIIDGSDDIFIGRISIENDSVYLMHDKPKWAGGRPANKELHFGFKYGWYLGIKGHINIAENGIAYLCDHENNKYLEND